ncbi:hypothetical protein [Paraburkholderia nemoris]|uniref:Uncharacterized protein n=1 Tax=Paraburkholderia nemoris TaxID=2793076 RepID=A0ABN7LIS7_9BURK|nr:MULTISPECIES: hypothetical protein [Paraburkholderia]MBK3812826.1 hypothetical protein [Paraburkholderia aspalathi]CAE6752893.1 hypothetical protein R69776_03010 [Paraburkholderia nemoris]CAE6830311.1 hypothetical protein R75777_06568 [Paraburkholderia nemoris]
MRYELTPTTITFLLDSDKKENPSKKKFSSSNLNLTEEELRRICTAMTLLLDGKSLATQRNYLFMFLGPLLEYFRSSGSKLPTTSDEWQVFLLYFFQFYLTDSYSTASVSTRIRSWKTTIVGILEFWMAEELLPFDAVIPKINLKKVRSETASQKLLGDSEDTPTIFSVAPQKILVKVDFAAPSADYLDEIQRSCQEKINVIKGICLAHWDALVHDKRKGDSFAKLISPTDITDVIQSNRYTAQIKGGSASPLASHTHPLGHAWALAVGKQLLLRGESRDCISKKSLVASKFFPKRTINRTGYKIFSEQATMPESALNQLASYERYFRFLGILSVLDSAAACALLTIEHPEFTSDAIRNARLLNARGKSYLLFTDNSESSIFSVDKPRAGKRKTVALTPIAQQLLKDIIELTTPIRSVLKRAGEKGWRYLFLGFGRGGRLGPLDLTAKHLNGIHNTGSLCRLYPSLLDHGLTVGTFDYRRIRTTMGVLRWFETGSIHQMSRRLGNSKRVVLEHYLPAALLHAWNTRIIRRFQNTLIVLAAHHEKYLLDATDFSSILDLQHFIAQLILDYPGNSSPLAKEVQTRLHQKFSQRGNLEDSILSDGVLNIQLSATSLTYLYAFSDFVVNKFNFDELSRVDSQTKLSPSQFVGLARLIRHACENEKTAFELGELLDLPRLRLMHQRATVELPYLVKKFEKFTLKNEW